MAGNWGQFHCFSGIQWLSFYSKPIHWLKKNPRSDPCSFSLQLTRSGLMSASRFREQPKLAFQVPSAGTVQSQVQAWSYLCEAQNNQQLDIYWIILNHCTWCPSLRFSPPTSHGTGWWSPWSVRLWSLWTSCCSTRFSKMTTKVIANAWYLAGETFKHLSYGKSAHFLSSPTMHSSG